MNYTLLNKQDLKLTDYFKKSPIMTLCMHTGFEWGME